MGHPPNCTESAIVAMTFGDRTIGSFLSRMAATILAAIRSAPFSRCLLGEQKAKVTLARSTQGTHR